MSVKLPLQFVQSPKSSQVSFKPAFAQTNEVMWLFKERCNLSILPVKTTHIALYNTRLQLGYDFQSTISFASFKQACNVYSTLHSAHLHAVVFSLKGKSSAYELSSINDPQTEHT